MGGKAGFSSRDTASVAPIEPMSQKSPRTSAFSSEPTFRLDPRQNLSAQPRCATPRQSLIQFDDCCGFSTHATAPGRLDVARGSDSPPVAAPDVIVLVVNCHRIVAKELSTRVGVDRKSLRRFTLLCTQTRCCSELRPVRRSYTLAVRPDETACRPRPVDKARKQLKDPPEVKSAHGRRDPAARL